MELPPFLPPLSPLLSAFTVGNRIASLENWITPHSYSHCGVRTREWTDNLFLTNDSKWHSGRFHFVMLGGFTQRVKKAWPCLVFGTS